jgi:hypothetical protein
LVSQATEILGTKFDPKEYLLSHATIVCSVDTDSVPNVKLGSVTEDGVKINRKFSNYYIKPESSKFVNNNGDAWTRPVLLKSYRTFIGAQNYLEHVQVEELSKGRIIDAVARDVGESLYVDILVATHRKHTELIADILSGKMNGMSMGCFVPGTLVTLADGRRVPIETIVPGDLVLTHLGNSKEVENVQIRFGNRSMRRVFVAGLQSPIEATDNHPFFVIRPAETCGCGCGLPLGRVAGRRGLFRRFLRGHDKRVYNPKSQYSAEEAAERQGRLAALMSPVLEEVTADRLLPGDMLVIPASKNCDADSSVSAARLLGYFLAEGSYTKYKGVHTGVELTFNIREKQSYVAEAMELFHQVFPGVSIKSYDRTDRNTTSIKVSGREVAAWFLLHAGEYSFGKKLSSEVMNWPFEAKKHLLGAWINGDGSSHEGRIGGVTTSFDLACQFHQILTQCGVYSTIYSRIGSKGVPHLVAASFQPSQGQKRSWFTVDISRTEAGVLYGYTNKVQNTGRQVGIHHVGGHVTAAVRSIETFDYEGPVYNMEVEGDHSYVVEGVAVHNCNTTFTTCTKCGNVAVDETELCNCIRYSKLNKFFTPDGKQRVIAELCGHPDEGSTAGVTFIEASWVANPAFTGAVLRNVIEPVNLTPAATKKAREVLSSPPPEWAAVGTRSMAASTPVAKTAEEFDFGGEEPVDEGMGDEESAATPEGEAKKEKTPLEETEDKLYKEILDRVQKRVKNEIDQKDESAKSVTAPNDTLIKNATAQRVYVAAIKDITRTASSIPSIVARIAALDSGSGVLAPETAYRVAAKVGALHRYGSESKYLAACSEALGRNPTQSEATALMRLGRILNSADRSASVPLVRSKR